MIIRLILYIFIFYIIYGIVKRVFLSGPKNSGRDNSGMISEMVQDPFCKTYIPRDEAYRATIKGEELLFCSRECAEKYRDNNNN